MRMRLTCFNCSAYLLVSFVSSRTIILFCSRRSRADSITCCKLLKPKLRFFAKGSCSLYYFITSIRPCSFLVVIDSLKGFTFSISLMCCSLFEARETGELVSSDICRYLVSGCSAKLYDLCYK